MEITRTGVPSLGDSENLDTKRACLFCKIVAGEIPSEKVFENGDFLAVKDAYPKLKGHTLVMPKKHFDDFMSLSPELHAGFLDAAKSTVKELGADNFNLAVNNGKVAGQIIPHLHMHILPRKSDDGFKFGL